MVAGKGTRRLRAYPTVAVDETRVATRLPEAMRSCLPVLRGRLASTVDHPEIYKRMETEYQIDMDRYDRLQAEREMRFSE